MQDYATKAVVLFVKDKRIPIAALAEKTELSPGILYPVFSGNRNLRGEELLKICKYFEVDPMRFYNIGADMAVSNTHRSEIAKKGGIHNVTSKNENSPSARSGV